MLLKSNDLEKTATFFHPSSKYLEPKPFVKDSNKNLETKNNADFISKQFNNKILKHAAFNRVTHNRQIQS
jgi:hypothetical protein